MSLDCPVFDLRHRIKHWLGALDAEQRDRLRGMDPEESLRSLLDGLHEAPPLVGSGLTLSGAREQVPG